MESGYALYNRSICVTMPRKMGVINAAQRVASEIGCEVGEEVGYSLNLYSKFSDRTLIKYMSDSSLIKEMFQDPLLRKYSIIMLDDVHERSLDSDLLMGLVKKILRRRSDLKIIISSATVDSIKIKNYFEDKKFGKRSNIYSISGTNYPVHVNYMSFPIQNYVVYSAQLCKEIHTRKGAGDILVFLPGREEIEGFVEFLL